MRLFLAAVVLLVISLLSGSKHLACSTSYRADKTIKFNSQSLNAETAINETDRERGLSGRACIGPSQSMLFEFEKSGYYAFWMKDMHFPIDIIWLNSNHQAVYLKTYVSPNSYPQAFSNDTPAKYVLEIQSGRADQLGITKGSVVSF